MAVTQLLRQVRLQGRKEPLDIAFAGDRIAAIAPRLEADAPEWQGDGHFACAGLTETHIHLDKAGILGRCRLCNGTLAEAVAETARLKPGFTEQDIFDRACTVVEQAVAHGTNRLRSFVEIDPRAGFRGFAALQAVQRAYRWAIDIELCAFAQEGLTNDPGTEAMLDQALAEGADLVGGCPYTDRDPAAHIDIIFALARRHDVAVDFHLDFDLQPTDSWLPRVIEATERNHWGGRVSVGHVTKLSAMPGNRVTDIGRRLAESGVAVTVLPATDLFLNGRDRDHLVPRGVAPAHRLAEVGVIASIASNNIFNPFTPFGDASLARMANLYAITAQIGDEVGLTRLFEMISGDADRLLGGSARRIEVGAPADVVLFAAPDAARLVAEPAPVVAGWKGGRQSFVRPPPRLFHVKQDSKRNSQDLVATPSAPE